MARPEVVELAAAIRRRVAREAQRHAAGRYEGIVESVEPLRLDVLGIDAELNDDDVEFGDVLDAHLADDGPLEVGDVLVLIESGGDYTAVDVRR